MIIRRTTSALILINLFGIILFLGACKKHSQKTDEGTGNSTQTEVLASENALREAALNGQTDIVNELLSQNTNVNLVDQDGRTALMYAAFNGHEEIAKALIDKGAEINTKDNYGRTALMFASTGPYPETVKLLLDKQADINIADTEEHFTALMYAAAEGQLEVVKVLLEYGADTALKDVDGDTAGTFAQNNGHNEVAELLSSASQ